MRLGSQDAALDQASERRTPDPVSLPGDAPEPVARVARPAVVRDLGQRRIENVVAERRGIDEHQSLEIRIDAVLERQIHQHRSGERQVE